MNVDVLYTKDAVPRPANISVLFWDKKNVNSPVRRLLT